MYRPSRISSAPRASDRNPFARESEDADAVARPPERRDRVHLVIAQGKVENVQVFGQPLATRRTRDGADTVLLNVPTQHDLRRRLAVAASGRDNLLPVKQRAAALE